ncbi:hypothetical protein HK101_003883 [Irineochytrium annulatum]|nr:hypothetical protein HK101_003883 [Irineochytrium annulatum]
MRSVLAVVASLAASVAAASGQFTGFVDGMKVQNWLGIPYAAPPVKDLRFKPPAAPVNVGAFNATAFGHSCYQDASQALVDTSEDCLTLNIYSPAGTKAGSNLPVMVWVHGGSFVAGGGALLIYNGSYLVSSAASTRSAVVLVTINYRLGLFGWLASTQLAAEGSLNVGLLDQRAAFDWVRANIAKFGGDPTKVTAVGESAGAISILNHIFAANVSSTLPFDRAITESGGPFGTKRQPSYADPYFNWVAKNVSCDSSSDVLSCLRDVDGKALFKADMAARKAFGGGPYGIIIDGTYIKSRPYDQLSTGAYLHIPVLLGGNTNEGTMFTPVNSSKELGPYFAGFVGGMPDAASQLAALYPTDGSDDGAFNASAALLGDSIFDCQERLFADSSSAPVYKYRFNRRPSFSILPTPERNGVYHAAELSFVFQFTPFLGTPAEQNLAAAMGRYWTTFAATGNPNPAADATVTLVDGSTGTLPTWPLYTRNATLPNGGGARMRFDGLSGVGSLLEIDNEKIQQCAFHENVYSMTPSDALTPEGEQATTTMPATGAVKTLSVTATTLSKSSAQGFSAPVAMVIGAVAVALAL